MSKFNSSCLVVVFGGPARYRSGREEAATKKGRECTGRGGTAHKIEPIEPSELPKWIAIAIPVAIYRDGTLQIVINCQDRLVACHHLLPFGPPPNGPLGSTERNLELPGELNFIRKKYYTYI